MEGNVNDMERAQDFLKAGNVKVGHPLPSPSPTLSHPALPSLLAWAKGRFGLTVRVSRVPHVSVCSQGACAQGWCLHGDSHINSCTAKACSGQSR